LGERKELAAEVPESWNSIDKEVTVACSQRMQAFDMAESWKKAKNKSHIFPSPRS
jgi:hypothetical protein